MNPTPRFPKMNAISRCLFAVAVWLASSAWGGTGEIYFGSVTPAEVASALVKDHPHAQAGAGSTAKKLRILSGPGLGASSSTAGIRLVEAAISPVTASPLGYASQVEDSLTNAQNSLRAAAAYRYSLGQGGENSMWNIQFEGVPPKTSPITTNFFPAEIDDAIAHARAAIRANPYKTGNGSGYALLFEAAYEATVPYTWSGNEWRAKAEKDRLGISDSGAIHVSPNTRIQSLETACDIYRHALEPFLSILNHEVESAWLLTPRNVIADAGPSWMPETETVEGIVSKRWTWSKLLYQAYVETVTQLSRARYELLYTQYLSQYGTGNFTGLISDIHSAAEEIDRLMLPVSALQAAGVLDSETDTGTPTSHSTLLRRLADHAVEGALFFSPGENPLSGGISFSTYGQTYVPFLVPAQLASRPFSFDNFVVYTHGNRQDLPPAAAAHPDSLIGEAILTDNTARTTVDDVIQRSVDLKDLWEDTQNQYETQLKQLCGQRRSSSGGSATVPDILGYFFPPEDRAPILQNETLGDIALQWNKIEQAETRVLSGMARS